MTSRGRGKSVRARGAGGSLQSQRKPASSPSPEVVVCSKTVVDSTPTRCGEDALQCEGCQLWFHRWCTGISVQHYSTLSVSDDSFYCFVCLQREMLSAVTSLKAKVGELQLELAKFKSVCSNDVCAPQQGMSHLQSYSPSCPPPLPSSGSHTPDFLTSGVVNSSSRNQDRKFNVIVKGLAENKPGTSRSVCQKLDLDKLSSALSSSTFSFDSSSVKDFYRLGKFQPDRRHPRPILIRFIRSVDASNLLLRRFSLTSVFLQPDRSKEERSKHAVLMKERWELICSGTPRSVIKVRGSSIYVRDVLHGKLDANNSYVTVSHDPSDFGSGVRSSAGSGAGAASFPPAGSSPSSNSSGVNPSDHGVNTSTNRGVSTFASHDVNVSSSHGVNSSSSHRVNSSSRDVNHSSCGVNNSGALTSHSASVGTGGLCDAGSNGDSSSFLEDSP